MDLALSSSTVLGAAVLVWLLWVAPYLMRKSGSEQLAAAGALLMEAASPGGGGAGAPSSDRPATTGSASTRSAEDDHGRAEPAGPPASRSTPAPLRIRWGRMGVALTGLAALVAALVTLVLMVVGMPGWVPPLCGAVAVGSVATLRGLAVRERKRRVDAAFGAAMRSPSPAPVPPATPAAHSEVFDAGRDPEPAPRAVSRDELRAIALEVARASQASADEAARASGARAEEWDPVQVPRPSYLDAAKAERPEPEPLAPAAEAKPEGRPVLKPTAEGVERGTSPGVAGAAARPSGRTGALGNLDEVLQRRRA
jgi:hypothetical protein